VAGRIPRGSRHKSDVGATVRNALDAKSPIYSEKELVWARPAADGPGRGVASSALVRLPRHLEFFSLGGVLATFWKPQQPLFPWVGTSSVLMLLSCWDLFNGAGRVDLIVMGLAGYELTIGLTEDTHTTPVEDGTTAS
jgi:hypothetical protein